MTFSNPCTTFRLAVLAACITISGIGTATTAAAFEWQPKARLHLDYASHDADVAPLDDGFIVRRAKVSVEGKFTDNWAFEVGYGMADDGELRPEDGSFGDVTLSYQGWQAGDIILGQTKLPFGLQELTSSNDINFVGRALPVDALTLSRRVGLAYSRERDAYTFTVMGFGNSLDGDDRGRGVAARVTLAPVHSADTVLHFGVAAVSSEPDGAVDFATTPESRVADHDFVDTGVIEHVDRINRIGLEGAWRTGPWSLQAEWMQARIARGAGYANLALDGWYVAGSWVLTGEMRTYKGGHFKGIDPDGRGGAWELTARYSRISLDDGPVTGGTERNITLGLNYHVNPHLRFMLNYIRVHSRRHGVQDKPGILTVRAQWSL